MIKPLRSMASTSTQMASSFSPSTPPYRYDAFLSFYGEDTRKSFTDHLHAALKHKGINVFRDDEKLERGKYISDELLKAIQESMYAIVVISKNYAFSRWCLFELTQIIECMRDMRLTVLPIFYHVDPSHIRNQTETFAEAFASHEKDTKVHIDMIQKWRAALIKVGKISGWHVHDRHESIVVEEISRRILSGLSGSFSNVSKDFVGMESRVKEMMTLLSKGLDDVRFLGIYGMGGIGKTTLSKAIYERFSHQFEASCFIAGIREETRSTHGLVYLKKQLIFEILAERELNIWTDHRLSRVIENRLRTKKVFIVLDDVDGEDQLEALVGSHGWFGEGSRIIITSRDRHLLKRYVDDTYEVKVLNDAEALRLFSWKAFKKPHPEENYVELSKDVVSYAQGLPLALKVFGSYLFGRTMDAWKSARDKLKENPSSEILDKLKISFDGLDDLQKQLFLDIACFFNGVHRDSIRHILESLGYYPDIDIDVLVDKSLLTISWGGIRLGMHDLLRKMGQQVVHDESEEPGRRSRLCHDKDVIRVLKNNTGTGAVKGIVLRLPLQKHERLNVEAFSKMNKLKILILEISNDVDIVTWLSKARDNLRTVEWHGDLSNFMLSNELCVMEWWGYPFESLPTSFQSDNLVELIMPYSCIKQPFDGRKSFDKLKHIDLSDSQNLIETPDLSGIPNLEKLELEHCTSLSKVHRSIGFLRQLKWLNLQDCKSLERLADEMRSESLEYLNLSGCSRLNKFPDFVGNMTSLWHLHLDGTAIKELPLSFKSFSYLVSLSTSHCSRLDKIPKNLISGMECLKHLCVARSGSDLISLLMPNSFSGLSSLIYLDLSYCNLSDGAIPSDFSCLSSLRGLNLSGNKFTRIPDSVWQLSNLITLNLSYCNLLDGAIPKNLCCLSSLFCLKLSGNKFTRIPDGVSQLSHLRFLFLEDCSWLQVLPKLPLGLAGLFVRNCPSLLSLHNQIDTWTSNDLFHNQINNHAYIDYDGNPCNILHLHPRSPLWTESQHQVFYDVVAYGPALLASGIPEWFNDRSTNSFGTIQMHIDLGSYEWEGYALFIVYQVHEPDAYPNKRRKRMVHEHESSNSRIFDVGNHNLPYFICQFQVNEVVVTKPLVFFAPGAPFIGPSGFWAYIPTRWFFERRERNSLGGGCTEWSNLEASITTGSLNVEVKECGARVVRDQHDASQFYQLLNSISPRGDLESYENIFSRLENGGQSLMVHGLIEGKDSAKGNGSLRDWLNQCNLTPKKGEKNRKNQ